MVFSLGVSPTFVEDIDEGFTIEITPDFGTTLGVVFSVEVSTAFAWETTILYKIKQIHKEYNQKGRQIDFHRVICSKNSNKILI